MPKDSNQNSDITALKDQPVILENNADLSNSEFSRSGDNLEVTLSDGNIITINGYFALETKPEIISSDGGVLTPELVNSFITPSSQTANINTENLTPAGEVTEVIGTVTITQADGTKIIATKGQQIFTGDTIETGEEGALNITFVDNTSFAISEDARLSIDEYIYDTQSQEGSSLFSMLKGAFVYTSGLIGKDDPGSVNIDTPVGSIGIRGTVIAGKINVAGEVSDITIIDGAIIVTNAKGTFELNNSFETIQLTSYQSIAENIGQMSKQEFQDNFSSLSKVVPSNLNSFISNKNEQAPESKIEVKPENINPEAGDVENTDANESKSNEGNSSQDSSSKSDTNKDSGSEQTNFIKKDEVIIEEAPEEIVEKEEDPVEEQEEVMIGESPSFDQSSYDVKIREFEEYLSSAVEVAATDADGDVITYSIKSGNDLGVFTIDETDGQITVENSALLDFKTNPNFNLVIEATDSNGNTSELPINISVEDSYAGLTITGETYTDRIIGDDSDNILSGRAGNDVIAGLGGNDTFSESGGADIYYGGRGADIFNITTGEFALIDGGTGYDLADITKYDNNDVTIDFSGEGISSKIINIEEIQFNGAAETGIYIDIDVNDIRLMTDKDNNLIIDNNTSNNMVLNLSSEFGAFNFFFPTMINGENYKIYKYDDADNSKDAYISINTNIVILTDQSPKFTAGDQQGRAEEDIREFLVEGTVIHDVGARVTDAQADSLTYSIINGNEVTDVNGALVDAFTINATTGIITVNSSEALSYGDNPEFNLTIEVSDGTNINRDVIKINLIDSTLGLASNYTEDFGTDGDDALNAGASQDFVAGFDGDDSTSIGLGNDIVYLGTGNDIVRTTDDQFNIIDGEAGADTLSIQVRNAPAPDGYTYDEFNMDFTSNPATNNIKNIEHIKFSGNDDGITGMHRSITINQASIQAMTDENNTLRISNEFDRDTLDLNISDTGYSYSFDVEGNKIYQYADGTKLIVEDSVSNIDAAAAIAPTDNGFTTVSGNNTLDEFMSTGTVIANFNVTDDDTITFGISSDTSGGALGINENGEIFVNDPLKLNHDNLQNFDISFSASDLDGNTITTSTYTFNIVESFAEFGRPRPTGPDLVIGDDTDNILADPTPGTNDFDNQLFVGLGGNDTIDSNGSKDIILAGDGNDTIKIFGDTFLKLDGGQGNDIVQLELDGNFNGDFVSGINQDKITNIETIEIESSGRFGNQNQSYVFDRDSIIKMTDDDNILTLIHSSGSGLQDVTINSEAGANYDGASQTYTYADGTQLVIDASITDITIA